MFSNTFHLCVGAAFSLTLEKAMVGDLGESLLLEIIFDSVQREETLVSHKG